ncbi:hypothetical protein EDD21DRAFT_364696 [Dissophora ornata]|nr:hypothetical protein EDD21DRAFT_364696 [Dissophora ornata]
MELHPLLGHQPRSSAIESVLIGAASKATKVSTVPPPKIKVFKDAVYYSYPPLGISLNYEPSKPLVPSIYSAKDAAPPDSSLLSLVAIHLYRGPTDNFDTFPLAFSVPCGAGNKDAVVMLVEMDMNKKAYEVVQLLGEPEEKLGGGRQGNCWIGFQKSMGLAIDFAGSNWEDRDMVISSLTLTQC